MEEGHGLVRWREAEHTLLGDNREMAFREALRIGRAEEYSLLPDERNDVAIDGRFARVVSLEGLGTQRTRFEVEKPLPMAISSDPSRDHRKRCCLKRTTPNSRIPTSTCRLLYPPFTGRGIARCARLRRRLHPSP
jgi:hypothetical protein